MSLMSNQDKDETLQSATLPQDLDLIVKKADSKHIISALIRENSNHDEDKIRELENRIQDNDDSSSLIQFKIEDLDEETLEQLIGEMMQHQPPTEEELSIQKNCFMRENTLKPPETNDQIVKRVEFP